MKCLARRLVPVALVFCAAVSSGTMAAEGTGAAGAGQPGRSFFMGFTPQPYAFTDEAFDRVYEFITPHSDLVAHHIDEGVPWPEALAGTPFHASAEKDIERRLRHRRPGQKVYLALSPLKTDRATLAGYWGADSHAPRPGPWSERGFDHPDVVKAYLRYCEEMIRRFQPDYFAYAIEVTDVVEHNPDGYPAFREFLAQVYRGLKSRHPDLPVFVTMTLGDDAYQRKRAGVIEEFMQISDLFAVSTYPYVYDGVGGDPQRLPSDWFSKARRYAAGKPVAIAETGFLAQTFIYLTRLVFISGSESGQADYVRRLLGDAQRLGAEFVVWFVPVDYDALWEDMKSAGMSPWFKQWRDTGLFDGDHRPREGLKVWDQWLERSRR